MAQDKRSGLTELGQFRSEFWTYYANMYPGDGVRRGFAGSNPDCRIEDTGLKVRLFLAQDQVGLWVTTLGKVEWREEMVELIEPYLPALEKEFGINPEELSDREFGLWESTAHRKIFIDTKDCNNWERATDWLHEQLTIYLRVLSEPTARQS